MLVALLAGTQIVTYLLVTSAARNTVTRQIKAKTDDAARLFERLLAQRVGELGLAVRLLSSDYAFASTFGQLRERDDPVALETLRSALINYRARIGSASFLRLASLDGGTIAGAGAPDDATPDAIAPALLDLLERSATLEATSVRLVDGQLFLEIIRPLMLPDPAAWVVVGFPLDDALAREFSGLSGFEIGFLHHGRFVAATEAIRNLDPAVAAGGLDNVRVDGVRYLGRTTSLPHDHGGDVGIVMLRSLDREMAPFQRLERSMIALSAIALAASVVLGVFVGRGVTRPVEELSESARRIRRGDFSARVPVRRRDELGRLGDAFNEMAVGLEERNRVRDLLGKTASPQIAAALVGAKVDVEGELREATILFTDLRGFTALSEGAAPREVLARLNEYFTETTAAIDEAGGIVDKFIGDSVMAIFGAPVDMADHADRALRAAAGILRAEENLNRRRQAQGLPPFKTGIGISTGVIVAGNIGSPDRYNYTVVGDEVNLASRLQALTKESRFGTQVICSDSTREALRSPHPLRDLGETGIRGKANAIRIWAVE